MLYAYRFDEKWIPVGGCCPGTSERDYVRCMYHQAGGCNIAMCILHNVCEYWSFNEARGYLEIRTFSEIPT